MKLRIGYSELWPCYEASIKDISNDAEDEILIDIPDDLAKDWLQVLADFYEVQEEIKTWHKREMDLQADQ